MKFLLHTHPTENLHKAAVSIISLNLPLLNQWKHARTAKLSCIDMMWKESGRREFDTRGNELEIFDNATGAPGETTPPTHPAVSSTKRRQITGAVVQLQKPPERCTMRPKSVTLELYRIIHCSDLSFHQLSLST